MNYSNFCSILYIYENVLRSFLSMSNKSKLLNVQKTEYAFSIGEQFLYMYNQKNKLSALFHFSDKPTLTLQKSRYVIERLSRILKHSFKKKVIKHLKQNYFVFVLVLLKCHHRIKLFVFVQKKSKHLDKSRRLSSRS